MQNLNQHFGPKSREGEPISNYLRSNEQLNQVTDEQINIVLDDVRKRMEALSARTTGEQRKILTLSNRFNNIVKDLSPEHIKVVFPNIPSQEILFMRRGLLHEDPRIAELELEVIHRMTRYGRAK